MCVIFTFKLYFVVLGAYLYTFESVDNSVLSIKFCQKKKQQLAKHCGIFRYAKSTSDTHWKSAKNKFAF